MSKHRCAALGMVVIMLAAGGAAWSAPAPDVASGPPVAGEEPDYRIGVGDLLQVFVWKNPDLSAEVPVRPDGRITTPLVQDIQAEGRSPAEVAADLRGRLSRYVQDPVVTVLVKTVAAPANAAAIRVIGAATKPTTVSYRAGLTALDVLIEAGGLTTFADGDGAQLIRNENGAYKAYPLRLKRLVRRGDLEANVRMMPGDIIRIPERWF